MDPFTLLLGFVIGIVISFFAIYVSLHIRTPVEKSAELTTMWTINNLGLEVRGIVESLEEVDLPVGSQIVCRESGSLPRNVINSCDVKIDPRVNENFLLGRNRGFMFLGSVRKSTLILMTEDDDLLMKLSVEFNSRWNGAEPYAEPAEIKDLESCVDRYVRIRGTVSGTRRFDPRGALPYSTILRLVNMGMGVDVLSKKPYSGEIEVIGKVRTEGGAVAIDAMSIKEIRS